MSTTIDDQLRELGGSIPIPDLPTGKPVADIPSPPAGDDMSPEFGAPRKRRPRARKPTQPPPVVEQGPAPEPAQVTLDPVAAQQIAKALGVGFRVIFAIIASKRGQHWQLQEQDEQLLAVTWTDALGPWLISNSKYVPLAVATLATVGVIVPRMDADARLNPVIEEPRNPDVPKAATPDSE